jgi:hypothetical protein
MSTNKFEILKVKYINHIYLIDDYGQMFIAFHDYKESAFKRMLANFKYSKLSEKITTKIKVTPVNVLAKIFGENKPVQQPKHEYYTLTKHKFSYAKLKEFCEQKNMAIEFMTKEEHDQIVKPRKKPFKTKRK